MKYMVILVAVLCIVMGALAVGVHAQTKAEVAPAAAGARGGCQHGGRGAGRQSGKLG